MSGPNYSYTNSVPQGPQLISATQNPILNNFQAINELITVNHIGFSDINNFGKHNFTNFVFQGSDPSTAATEMAIYSKATPSGPNAAELFGRYENDGTVFQITNQSNSSGISLLATNGYAVFGNYLGGPSAGGAYIGLIWGTATGLVSPAIITTPVSQINSFGPTLMIVPIGPTATYTHSWQNVFPGAYIEPNQFVITNPGGPGTYPTSVFWSIFTIFTI